MADTFTSDTGQLGESPIINVFIDRLELAPRRSVGCGGAQSGGGSPPDVRARRVGNSV